MKKTSLFLFMMLAAFNSYADSLPDVFVENVNFKNTSLDLALSEILQGTGIKAKVEPRVNYVINSKNLSGYLPDVVEFLASKSDVKYRLENKILYIESKAAEKPVEKKQEAKEVVAVANQTQTPSPVKVELKTEENPSVKNSKDVVQKEKAAVDSSAKESSIKQSQSTVDTKVDQLKKDSNNTNKKSDATEADKKAPQSAQEKKSNAASAIKSDVDKDIPKKTTTEDSFDRMIDKKVTPAATDNAKKEEVKPSSKDIKKEESKKIPEKAKSAEISPDFVVKKDQLASYTLKEYLDRFGYLLFWNVSHDIKIAKDTNYYGSPEDVADAFLRDLNLNGYMVDGEKSIYVK